MTNDDADRLALRRAGLLQRRPAPRVEVVTFRDPDAATDCHVFVDGEKATGYQHTDVDPGAGYTASGWASARRAAVAAASSAAGELIGRWYDAASDSSYIEDDRPWSVVSRHVGGGEYVYDIVRSADYPWQPRHVRKRLTHDEAEAYLARLLDVATAAGVWGR